MTTISIAVEWSKVWSSNNGIKVEFLAHKCVKANFYTLTSLWFSRANAAGSGAARVGQASVRIHTCKIYRDQVVLQVHCLAKGSVLPSTCVHPVAGADKVWAGGWNAGWDLGSQYPPWGYSKGPALRGRALGSVCKTDPYMVSGLALWNVDISKHCIFSKG